MAGLCFVFRRSGSLIGLYVGFDLRHGAPGYFKSVSASSHQEHSRRCGDGVGVVPFLLRRIHLEGAREIDQAISRYQWRTADVSAKGFLPGWALHGAKWVAFSSFRWERLA
jgi:hypothetical protein